MADNKKVESPKAGADPADAQVTKEKVQDTPKTSEPATASATVRTPADQPAESVAVPSVDEVKTSGEVKPIAGKSTGEETMKQHVDAVAKSVESYNESSKAVASAKPFVKPETKTAGPVPTAEKRLAETVEAVAKSVAAYNESSKTIDSPKSPSSETPPLEKEESRVAPLTGELRPNPDEDSYVTPGKVLAPKSAPPGQPQPEYDPPPKVISPLSGEIKNADEVSYPTPGHVRDSGMVAKVLSGKEKTFVVNDGKGKFGVAPGQQVPLLQANEEAWANDEARLNDQKARALEIAQALSTTDGLRRTRRVQKNLR